MSAAAPPPAPRPAARAIALACLAQLYFTAMFFVAAPAGILWLGGRDLAPRRSPLALAGLLAVALANAFVVHLVASFVREGQGTQVPLQPPRRMLARGAYAHTRNPMYLSYVAVVLGEALLFHSWPIALYAAALWALLHAYVVWREEPLLRRRFGAAYADYAGAVPRWLPRGGR